MTFTNRKYTNCLRYHQVPNQTAGNLRIIYIMSVHDVKLKIKWNGRRVDKQKVINGFTIKIKNILSKIK